MFERAIKSGKKLYFPRVAAQGLEFCLVSDPAELTPGALGVPEPPHDAQVLPAEDLDLLIVPGMAFDAAGSRLGFGKGLYDRALAPVDPARRAGFCYSFQIVDVVPAGEGDEPVGLIITERGVIYCNRRSIQ